MAKNQMTEVNGVVSEALPNMQFRVTLEDGREILAHLAGRMRLPTSLAGIPESLDFNFARYEVPRALVAGSGPARHLKPKRRIVRLATTERTA